MTYINFGAFFLHGVRVAEVKTYLHNIAFESVAKILGSPLFTEKESNTSLGSTLIHVEGLFRVKRTMYPRRVYLGSVLSTYFVGVLNACMGACVQVAGGIVGVGGVYLDDGWP